MGEEKNQETGNESREYGKERVEMIEGSVSLRTLRAAFCVYLCMCLCFTDLRWIRAERESHCVERWKMEEREAHDVGP